MRQGSFSALVLFSLLVALPSTVFAAAPQTLTTDKHTVTVLQDLSSTEISISRSASAGNGAGFADPVVSWLIEPTRLIIDIPGETIGRNQSRSFESGDIAALRVGSYPEKGRFVIEFRNGGKRAVSMVRAANRGAISFMMPTAAPSASPAKIAVAPVKAAVVSKPAVIQQSAPPPSAKPEIITAPKSPVTSKVVGEQTIPINNVAIVGPEVEVVPPPPAIMKVESPKTETNYVAPLVKADVKLIPIEGDPFPYIPVLLGMAAFFLTLGYGMNRVATVLERPARVEFAPELDGMVQVLRPVATTGIATRIEREVTPKSEPIRLEEKDEWPSDSATQ